MRPRSAVCLGSSSVRGQTGRPSLPARLSAHAGGLCGRIGGAKGRRSAAIASATEKEQGAATLPRGSNTEDVDNCEYNVGQYCTIDSKGKRVQRRSLGEMEQEFLEALRAWYYDGSPIMTNEEFEVLKDELIWQGSTVAILSSAEQKFLEASLAYSAGKPIMSDAEYDDLKRELKQSNSFVAMGGPRCSLRSRKMYSDLEVDYIRMLLLNVPATLLVLGVLFFFDDLTGFEISKIIELPEPWGIVALWGLVLPACFVLSSTITNFVVQDGIILKGQCPNCGTQNLSYFGNILTVEGNKDKAEVQCSECKAVLEFNERKREMVVVSTSF